MYRSFEAFSDGNLEGIVTVVGDGINAGVMRLVFGLLGAVFYGHEYGIMVSID